MLPTDGLTVVPDYDDVEGHPSPIERVVILDYILTEAFDYDDRMALFVRQLHFLAQNGGELWQGKHWIYKTYEAFLEYLPWGHREAVKYVVEKLRRTGVLLSQNRLYGGQRYRLDYRKLQGLCLTKTRLSPTWLDTAVSELPDREDFQPELAAPPPLDSSRARPLENPSLIEEREIPQSYSRLLTRLLKRLLGKGRQ